MKRCEKCGAEMLDAQVICSQCGYKPLKPVERVVGVIPLEDVGLWSQLDTAYRNGAELATSLRKVRDAPPELAQAVWNEQGDLWGALNHQNSVYEGSFAAVPHLVTIAAEQPPGSELRHDLLALVGSIAADGGCSLATVKPGGWRAAFMPTTMDAFRRAIDLLGESLAAQPSETTAKWLLASIAAIYGYEDIWYELQYLGDPVTCPKCGERFTHDRTK